MGHQTYTIVISLMILAVGLAVVALARGYRISVEKSSGESNVQIEMSKRQWVVALPV